MSVPQISALARAAERADPADPGEQGLLMLRVRELEKLMRDAHANDLASCLAAAGSLAEILSREGDVTRAHLHEASCRILRAVELAFSGGLPPMLEDRARDGSNLPLINDMVLGQILIQLGHVTEHQLRSAVSLQQQTGRRIGDILVESGVVSREIVEAACRIQERLRTEAQERRKAKSLAPKQGVPSALREVKPEQQPGDLQITESLEAAVPKPMRRRTNDYLLGQILVQMGLVKTGQVERASKDARAAGIRIGEALVRAKACRWEDVERAVKVQGHLRRMAGVEADASGPLSA